VTELVYIRVYGTPAPQGSKSARPIYAGSGPARHFTGRINQVESSKHVPVWRDAVKAAALEQRGQAFGPGVPLAVRLRFYLKRRAGDYGTGRNAAVLRPAAPAFPTGKKDDIDKLARAVLDGLTDGGAWHDDGQVASLTIDRDWADNGELPGCEIWIGVRNR
jgi:Holliday junction resolvase RusA-like endonuclease